MLGGRPDQPIWQMLRDGVPFLVLRGEAASAFFAIVKLREVE